MRMTAVPGEKQTPSQGERDRKRTVWISGLIVFLVAGAGYIYYLKTHPTSTLANGEQPQTAVVQKGNIVLTATGTGTLIPQTDASFGFQTGGQITRINVKIGDHVETGQVLAQLDDTLAQIKYSEAEQSLLELHSAASLATVQKEIATAQDAGVAAHDWLSYLLSPEVLIAEEELTTAQGRLATAQTAAQSNPSDEANKAVTEMEDSVTYLTDKLAQAQAYYNDVYLPEKFGEYQNVGSRRHPKIVPVTYTDPYTGQEIPVINIPSVADIAKARNDYAQAEATISEGQIYLDALNTGIMPDAATGTGLSDLYNAQQSLNNAQAALDATQLVSPMSGIVTSLYMNVGEQAGTSPVITVSGLSQPYRVDAYLDETDWGSAKLGNNVNVSFDLLPDQSFPGSVTTVYPQLEGSGNSLLVHVIVQLEQSLSQELPAGTGASISVIGGEADNVLRVPVNAVHKKDGGYIVTVLQNGQKIDRVVEIGLRNESYVEIISGLEAGETVLTG